MASLTTYVSFSSPLLNNWYFLSLCSDVFFTVLSNIFIVIILLTALSPLHICRSTSSSSPMRQRTNALIFVGVVAFRTAPSCVSTLLPSVRVNQSDSLGAPARAGGGGAAAAGGGGGGSGGAL